MLMINLYVNTSDNNVVDKKLTTVFSNVTYEFKTETSQMNPVLIIDRSYWNEKINYVYIDELKRYYYVKDVVFLTGKLIMLVCAVDVLMCFKAEIRQLTAILKRQESIANAYITDTETLLLSYDEIGAKIFPNGFTTNTKNILIVAGGE